MNQVQKNCCNFVEPIFYSQFPVFFAGFKTKTLIYAGKENTFAVLADTVPVHDYLGLNLL